MKLSKQLEHISLSVAISISITTNKLWKAFKLNTHLLE